MPDEAPLPRKVTIRPAGWVVIVVALVGVGWLVWHLAAPWVKPLLQRPTNEAAAPPVAAVDPREAGTSKNDAPAEEAAQEPSSVLSGRLFPQAASRLPAPSSTFPRLALPPLAGLNIDQTRVLVASGEREALRRLVRGEADYALVSIAALASVPEVTDAGARVVWSLGAAPDTARLFPSCNPDSLRRTSLGAEAGSAGHLQLLAAFMDSDRPPIALFNRYASLEHAISNGEVTGGSRLDAGVRCDTLPVAVTTLLIVRGPNVDVDPARVSAIAALVPNAASPEDVASFFDESRATPGGFFEVYRKTQQVWQRVGLVTASVPPAETIDRFLLGPAAQPVAEEDAGVTRAGFGRPAWPDLH